MRFYLPINPSQCRRLWGAAALLLTSFGAQAQVQPGYLVLTANPTDTLRGETDLRQLSRAQGSVTFRATASAPARSYPASELQAAGYTAGLLWRRVVVPQGATSRSVLLEVLVAGPASLYRDPTGTLPATYYLDKPGRSPMPLKREQFAQVLQTSFADCATANTQVAYAGQYVYSVADLRRYVVNYNQCVYPQTRVLVPSDAAARKAERGSLRWAAQAGAAQVQFFYPYLNRRRGIAGPLAPTVGADVWVPFNRYLGLVAGLTLTGLRSDNTAEQPVPNAAYNQIMRYRTRGALLMAPVSVRLSLRPLDATWRPYLQVGGHFSRIMSGGLHWNNSYSGPGPAVPSGQDFELYYGGIGGGVQAETGVLLRLGRHHLGTSLRYAQTNGFPNTGRSFLIDFTQASLNLSYLY